MSERQCSMTEQGMQANLRVSSIFSSETSAKCLTTTAVVTFAARFLTREPAFDNGGRATDARMYRDGVCGAVAGASATFHAPIFIFDPQLAVVFRKYPMWANFRALAATDAGIRVQCQSTYIFQIFLLHDYPVKAFINIKTIPTERDVTIKGSVIFISFITPEWEANVDEPVNCIVRYAVYAGRASI